MKKKISLILGGCLLFSLLFTGCSIGDKQVYFATKSGRHTVFKIGGLQCQEEEAKLYLANYKNIYGNVYDTPLWSEQYNTQSMEDSMKDAVMEHLQQVYALNVYALDQEITLDEAELDQVTDAAEEYYASLSRKEIRYMGLSKKELVEICSHYALAEKVYSALLGSVDENVSEDEARIMDALKLFVTDKELAEQIQAKLHDGATFERLASTYNETESYHATFGRGTFDATIEDIVFQLDDDECSDMIAADGGYYFFQCVDKYNEELSEKNKIEIVKKRQQQVITDVIAEQELKYYSDFNEKLWDKITIKGEDTIETSSFFVTMENHLNY